MISKNEIKFIKSLKLKKYRNRERQFLVEGEKNVDEVLASKLQTLKLFCTGKVAGKYLARGAVEISEAQMAQISTLKTNETCLAVASMPAPGTQHVSGDTHTFVLDRIADPGNLGTIIRTLDWFGYHQLVCSEDCADFFHPKTISASMGSFTRLQPMYHDLDKFLAGESRPVYGLALGGEPLESVRRFEPSIFVMGSESHGIRDSVLARLTHQLRISGHGQAESLNVAIATAIVAFHLRSCQL